MVTRVGLWGKSHDLPAAIWTWHMQADGSNLAEFWQYRHSGSLFSSAVIFLAFQSPEVMGLAFFLFLLLFFRLFHNEWDVSPSFFNPTCWILGKEPSLLILSSRQIETNI